VCCARTVDIEVSTKRLSQNSFWPLSVILSEAKDLSDTERLEMLRFEILRFAQDDNHELRLEMVSNSCNGASRRAGTLATPESVSFICVYLCSSVVPTNLPFRFEQPVELAVQFVFQGVLCRLADQSAVVLIQLATVDLRPAERAADRHLKLLVAKCVVE